MYHKYIYLILMFSILFASPSFAQKRGLSKILKAVTENSVKTPITKGFIKPEGLIKPKLSPRKLRTEALKTAAKVDHFFTERVVKHQMEVYPLLDAASFRLYHKDYGLVPAITNFWSKLIDSMEIVQTGPYKETKRDSGVMQQISADSVRKDLLQREVRMEHSLKEWQKFKSAFTQKTPKLQSSTFSPLHEVAPFLFDVYTGVSPFGLKVFRYTVGTRNIIQTIASDDAQIAKYYSKILAWAHGQEKFPFTSQTVSKILQLDASTVNSAYALQEKLNSPGSNLLRSWGWTNKDIRQFITQYYPDEEADFSQANILWKKWINQFSLYGEWVNYWDPIIKQKAATSDRVMQLIKNNR